MKKPATELGSKAYLLPTETTCTGFRKPIRGCLCGGPFITERAIDMVGGASNEGPLEVPS